MADRLERTRSVVQLVHSMDFAVEAEVGHITRRGTDSERAAELIADVATAVEFCEGTGVDVIAAAVGNVHGLRTGESHLDEELVRSLVEKVPAAISLHGGSGLAGADVTRAIKLGVRKISYFNNLGREALTAMQSAIAGSDDPAFTTVMAAGNAAYQAAVVRQLRAYAASGKAAAVETSHPKADH
jgi:fructose/tagatose bisphosphate aldolase